MLTVGELGVSQAECKRALCGSADNNGLRRRTTVSGALSAHFEVASGRLWGAYSLATLGPRYSVTPVTLPAPDGDRSFVVHGLQAVPGYSLGFSYRGPFQHRERGLLMQVNVPIGLVVAPGAPAEKTAFAISLELRVLLPF
jgi:hypothetical protein